jgi:hypothetical protein
VSGEGGAHRFEGLRSRGYPCPPMPRSRLWRGASHHKPWGQVQLQVPLRKISRLG